jgi:hypothetical protein
MSAPAKMYQYLSGEQVNTSNVKEESCTAVRGLGVFYRRRLLSSSLPPHYEGE